MMNVAFFTVLTPEEIIRTNAVGGVSEGMEFREGSMGISKNYAQEKEGKK